MLRVEKTLAVPFVAALVTLALRLLTYALKDQLPLPYHFGITTPNSDAETWKEAVFWKQQFGVIPDYLLVVIPWFVEYIPPAPSAVYVAFLSLFDALTVFLVTQWPSANMKLIFTLFVINPVMIFLPALESLAPLEHFLLTVIIECCRRRRGQAWLIYVARLFASILGFFFIAVIMALWLPCGIASAKRSLFCGLFGVLGAGGFGLLYLFLWGDLSTRTSLYAPPDSGVMWYVRLLIIPVFSRCLDVFQLQLPAILTLPLAVALPPEVPGVASRHVSSVPGDRRLLLVLFAVCVSKLCRYHLALPDYSLALLFMYSLLDKTGNRKRNKENAKMSMFDRVQSANVFVPVYTVLLLVPLMYSFYTGWVLWDMANPNWVFFPQVAFVIVGGMFITTFFSVVVEAIMAEGATETRSKQA